MLEKDLGRGGTRKDLREFQKAMTAVREREIWGTQDLFTSIIQGVLLSDVSSHEKSTTAMPSTAFFRSMHRCGGGREIGGFLLVLPTTALKSMIFGLCTEE